MIERIRLDHGYVNLITLIPYPRLRYLVIKIYSRRYVKYVFSLGGNTCIALHYSVHHLRIFSFISFSYKSEGIGARSVRPPPRFDFLDGFSGLMIKYMMVNCRCRSEINYSICRPAGIHWKFTNSKCGSDEIRI